MTEKEGLHPSFDAQGAADAYALAVLAVDVLELVEAEQ